MTLLRPASLDEALDFLASTTGDATPVAGCTDLMAAGPNAWRDLCATRDLVDLSGITELRGIQVGGDGAGHIDIGAAVTFTELREHFAVREHLPMLAAIAATVGACQIQNRATLGGNMANASPAGDSLPVLLALDATVLIVGQNGTRSVPYNEFHRAYRETALAPGELIHRIHIPIPDLGGSWFLHKVGARSAQAISTALIAARFNLSDGRMVRARIAVGSVAPIPLRLLRTEEVCDGAVPTPDLADRAAALARSEITPIDDVRSIARYRSYAVGRLVRRAIMELLQSQNGAKGT